MSQFLVELNCKPYVKRFLEINYGDSNYLNGNIPIEISKDKILYAEFQQKLKNKSSRHDNSYANLVMKKYSEVVYIRISQDDFYRHGWELTKTDMIYLNLLFEGRCKLFMYTIVGSRVAMGATLASSIDYFQEKYSFTEDVWQKGSIIKDCQRNMPIKRNEIYTSISNIFDKILLAKLSANRTISQKAKTLYENNNF